MIGFWGYIRKNLLVVILTILLFVSSTIIGIGILRSSAEANKAERYSLLSKRLFAENQNDIFVNLAPLREQVRDYLSKTNTPHSFYLEYLPSGTSIRVGDSEEFVGASLMKIPVIMDLYRAYELGRLDPDQMVTIDQQAVSSEFGGLYQAGTGSSIKLNEAARLALTESDNTAARVVLERTQKALNPKERSLNFLDVGLTQSKETNQQLILISARAYTSFLKCLYLACYVNYDNSQEILSFLTQTNFHNRIEDGLADKSVKVAHKIGTFSDRSSSDCGIIYVPKRPYSFCLMINSTDPNADKIIADVSKMAYDYITTANN